MHIIADQILRIQSANKGFKSYYIYFVPRRTMLCERALEERNVYGSCICNEFQLDLLPFEEDVLSLELPRSFRECFLVCFSFFCCFYPAGIIDNQVFLIFIGKRSNGFILCCSLPYEITVYFWCHWEHQRKGSLCKGTSLSLPPSPLPLPWPFLHFLFHSFIPLASSSPFSRSFPFSFPAPSSSLLSSPFSIPFTYSSCLFIPFSHSFLFPFSSFSLHASFPFL